MGRSTLRQTLPAGILLVLALTGCQSAGYYGQALWGQAEILAARRPIAELLGDPRTPPAVKEQLSHVLAVRQFAETELLLPAGNSYRSFARVDRPWAVWSVFAAPELSLTPKTWCYPIVGCAAYRGYFSEDAARGLAESLSREGYDVYVTGVLAYSTLGWFEDPVLSTFLRLDRSQLAALIFHELAHRLLFVPGDTEFNESFASAVEEEGLRRWTTARGTPEVLSAYRRRQSLRGSYLEIVSQRKAELEALYADDIPLQQKRVRKAEILAGLRGDWERIRLSHTGIDAYADWFAVGCNNAGLAAVSAYHAYVPAFRNLLRQAGGSLTEFYRQARTLADCADAERRRRLELLLAPGPATEGPDDDASGA